MNVYETFFLLQLLIMIGIFFLKLWNILTNDHFICKIPFNISLMWLIGAFLDFTIGFVVMMIAQPNTLIALLFLLETPLLIIIFALFITEFAFNTATLVKKPREAHNAFK